MMILAYLLTKNEFVKIKKLEFNWDKAFKQIEKLKRKLEFNWDKAFKQIEKLKRKNYC